MTDLRIPMTRRSHLAMLGGGLLVLGAPLRAAAQDAVTVRQGYQTNLWGMPTYYLVKSGALEKQGIKIEEYPVPSGNATMQQMVARQVDLGTFAGQSFLLGAEKGDLIAIAQIEQVGKTARVMVRKDLGITRMEDLRGKKIANQTGSSTGNIFVDRIAPKYGLKKGDYQEVRMNVNDMVAALASKTVDAMANVEPYNAIAEAEGLAITLTDYSIVDQLPVLMAATPDFVEKHPDAIVSYLKAWLDVGNAFKTKYDEVADVIFGFYSDKGYNLSKEVFRTAMSRVEVDPGFPAELQPYLKQEAQTLIELKRIKAEPDWSRILRPDFMEKARKA